MIAKDFKAKLLIYSVILFIISFMIFSGMMFEQIGKIKYGSNLINRNNFGKSDCYDDKIIIKIGNPTNKILRPLLGVNIGPLPAGNDPANADLTMNYKEIGVNLIRTHDFYGPLDMSEMYPDYKKNPNDIRSYNFNRSDIVWKSIVESGFEPYFRLGDSWNNCKPPKDEEEMRNWVNAVIEVVRHFREGKWNGFNTKFRFVEIWNEPDNQRFWPKPNKPEEFFQLYTETAIALKKNFPDLLIGGPGITQASVIVQINKKWLQDFLKYIKKNNAPLDFFSFHIYSNNPENWYEHPNYYRDKLNSFGFNSTELHITEWNTDTKIIRNNKDEEIELRAGSKGASILTSAWIAMQESGITVSTFYRGPDPDIKAPEFYGMFYADGKPKKIAFAFSLWAKMTTYQKQLEVISDPKKELWILGGINNENNIALLISNPTNKKIQYTIKDIKERKIQLNQVNDKSQEIQNIILDEPTTVIDGYSVQLLIFQK